MRVAAVQSQVKFGDRDANLAHIKTLLSSTQADLYVLPELFHTGYFFADRHQVQALAEPVPDGPTIQSLIQMAEQKSCLICAGVAEKEQDKLYNAAVLVGPDGWINTYRKIHLFDREKEWFDPGPAPFSVTQTHAITLGTMICFDWIFPESMRSLALLGAGIVCHPANLVLPYCQNAMTIRCLENGVFAVTANRIGSETQHGQVLRFTGQSQITGPRGHVLARADAHTATVITADIDIRQAQHKNLTNHNDLLADRRPALYHLH